MDEPAPQTDASRPSGLRLAGFLAVALGGLLLGVGAVLNWAVIGIAGSHGLDSEIRGTDVWEGRVILAVAVLVLFGVIALRVATEVSVRRAIAIAITVLGLFATGLAVGDAIRARSRFAGGGSQLEKLTQAIARGLGRPIADVLAQLQQSLSKIVTVKVDAGLWLVVAGGILAAAGGVLSIVWANREEHERTQPATRQLAEEAPDER
ncbi:MAG: hypothetical protein M3O98_11370 [Actinomycetota bacterium]|nr:hypothetical protein [Actinomycetota bacterium]